MLYIMRHGRTDWNDLAKLQGQTDIPLNEDGRALARAAAREYRDVHLDRCYCSPLLRAKETAEILLAGREVPIQFDDRLKEMNFGVCEGITDYFTDPTSPIHNFFQHPELYTEPVEGAESMDELFARTGSFLKECVYPKLAEGKDILIVGHGAMNCSIVCQVLGLPVSEFWSRGIPNCKMIKLIG